MYLDNKHRQCLSNHGAHNLFQVVSSSCHLPPKIDFPASFHEDSHTLITFDIAENRFDDGLPTPIYLFSFGISEPCEISTTSLPLWFGNDRNGLG